MNLTFFYLDSILKEHDAWGMFIRDCKQFINLKRLSKVEGEIGIVLIEESDWRNNEKLVYSLIKKHSNNKKLFFMLCDTSEGYPTRYLYHPFFDFLEECGIDKKRRLFMYNNSLHPRELVDCERFYSIYYPSFVYEFSNLNEKIESKNFKPSYDFSCFNRKSKTHKMESVEMIIKRNLNCAITFDYFNDTDFKHSSFLNLQEIRPGSYLHDSDYFLGKINICTESEFYSTFNQKATAATDHQWDDMIHLTEKVFRNIAWGIPYVLISSKGSLNEIRRLGFKTFDSLIDESYDMANDSVRMDLALDAAQELLKTWGSDELNEILNYNKQKMLKYNQDAKFFNLEIIEPLKKHINNLVI